MTNDIVPSKDDAALPVELNDLADEAHDFILHTRAERTRIAYANVWKRFTGWCAAKGLEAMPATPDVVALYVTDMARDYKVSTIGLHIAGISVAHQLKGHPSPTRDDKVRELLKGIRRKKGTAPTVKKPLMTPTLRAMVAGLPDTMKGTRDKAILLLGFAGAFRRGEIVGIDVEDCHFGDDGLTITLWRSKTNQEGRAQKVGIPRGAHTETCPVRALQAWLDRAGITEGAVFRGVRATGQVRGGRLSLWIPALIVKQGAERLGLDPSDYAGHSLRSGHATSAAANGAQERSIMKQTGHKSVAMLRRYIRDGSLFTDNSATMLGL